MSLTTVWSQGAVDDVPPAFRALERWVFPSIYALAGAVIGIIGAITGGTRPMQAYLTPTGATTLCIVIGVSALIAFAGVVIRTPQHPRRSRQFERNGAGLLMSATSCYALVLVYALANSDGGPPPLTTIAMTAVFAVLSWFRIRYLSRELGRLRKAEART